MKLPLSGLVALFVFFAYALFFEPGSWNQNARMDPVFAFVEPGTPDTHSFRINQFTEKNTERNLYTGDWAFHGKAQYSNKGPGSTILALIAYYPLFKLEKALNLNPTSADLTKLNKYLINLWGTVFFSALAAGMLYAFFRRRGMNEIDSLISSALYAFGTLVFPYSISYWGHATAAALLLISVTLLEARSSSRILALGFAAGAAVTVEYFAAISLPFFFIYLLFRDSSSLKARLKRPLWFVLGAALPIFGMCAYQKACFGGYWVTAASQSNANLFNSSANGMSFGAPSLSALIQLLGSPLYGFFIFMPFLIPVIVLGAIQLMRPLSSNDRKMTSFCLANIGTYFFALSCFDGWRGGWCVGPRYLIVALPFFVPLLPRLSGLNRRLKSLYLFLAGLSIFSMSCIACVGTLNSASKFNLLYGDIYGRFLRYHWGSFIGWEFSKLPWLAILFIDALALVFWFMLKRVKDANPVRSQ